MARGTNATVEVEGYISNVTFDYELTGTNATFDIVSSKILALAGVNDASDRLVVIYGEFSFIAYVPGVTQFPTYLENVSAGLILHRTTEGYNRVTLVPLDSPDTTFTYAYSTLLTVTITDYDKKDAGDLRNILSAFKIDTELTLGDYAGYMMAGYTGLYNVFISNVGEITGSPNFVLTLAFLMLAGIAVVFGISLIFRIFRNGG